jgi:hypothetical protein
MEDERRQRVLTDADLEALATYLKYHNECAFRPEEIQFVKDWMDTMKTAKSEVIRWVVRGIFIVVGVTSGIIAASKMGLFKGVVK